MNLYKIVVQKIRRQDGWTSSVGVPTFYVDACDADAARRCAHLVIGLKYELHGGMLRLEPEEYHPIKQMPDVPEFLGQRKP